MIEASYLRRTLHQLMLIEVDSSADERYLQSYLGSNYTSNNTGGKPESDNRYEFVAFLLWYIFLVLCCVVPTCCAYHRRRMMEQRLALHRNAMRQNSNSLFFLSNLQQQQQQQSANHARNSELAQQERLAILREELKGTTMIIKAENIIVPPKIDSKSDFQPQQSGGGESAATLIEDVEYVDEIEDCGQSIQLPSIGVNTNRIISGVCTICLCPYEDGDQISWSTEESCQHAFHTDCIIPWLAKKEEPKCPVCRQEYCATPNVSHIDDAAFDIDLERENSFLHSFSQALAMSHLYRPSPFDGSNNYEQTRNAITLQLATLALENQIRLEQQAAVASSSTDGPAILNSDAIRTSSRVIGEGSTANLQTPSHSTEMPSETTNNSTNNTSDDPSAP